MSGDHPNYSIVEIDQNTKKSPGDLRRLAVTYSRGKPSANAGVKNSQKSKMIIIHLEILKVQNPKEKIKEFTHMLKN